MTTDTEVSLPVLHSSAAESFSYYGEREGWLIALSQHRDADALERSNWFVITDSFFTRFPGLVNEDYAIEQMSHWAVGWVEYLLVRPGTPAAAAAIEWRTRLANYPVADDEHHSMLEHDEEWCVRCDRGTRVDHPINGCKFRSEEEAHEIRWRWRTRRER